MINLVAGARKKYLFAVVVTVALVAAILVYLYSGDYWGLAAITALAILLCMLVALFILPSMFVASAKLQTTKQSRAHHSFLNFCAKPKINGTRREPLDGRTGS